MRRKPFMVVILCILLSTLFCSSSTSVRNRGAVRLIRARVQQEIRWAFVTSCVSHSFGAVLQFRSVATADRIQKQRWPVSDVCQFVFPVFIFSCTLNDDLSDYGFCYFMAPLLVFLLRHFPFVWTPPVSSRFHFAFHPHPLVRTSAAL